MLLEYIKIVATVFVAALGWIVAHYFTSQKSRNDKKRDLSIEYLSNAYRFLTTEIVQRDISDESWAKLEKVITDVQLFGSPEQVELIKNLVECIVQGGEFELDELINSLRKDLRKELGLEAVSGNVKWFRYTPRTDDSPVS
jgi:hypothetical protein